MLSEISAISEIVAVKPGIEPRTSCSASQELNHYTTATKAFLSLRFIGKVLGPNFLDRLGNYL